MKQQSIMSRDEARHDVLDFYTQPGPMTNGHPRRAFA